jgi:replicative DNA helicase Mcm
MMDRSTGVIDIDTTMTGIPKSQRDRVNTVLDIVVNLQKEFDEVEINKIVDRAREVSIDEIAARRIIEDLVSRGELYKPQHGYVRLVIR